MESIPKYRTGSHRPTRILLLNLVGMALFVSAALALEHNAGYLPGIGQADWTDSVWFRWVAAVVFWSAAISTVPVSIWACQCAKLAAIDNQSPSWHMLLARIEAWLWLLIWIGFACVFWPAIMCGWHIHGIPAPAHWPTAVWHWLEAEHKAFVHWASRYM